MSFASTCRGSGTGLRRGCRLVRWWRQHWIRWSVRPVPGVLSSAVSAVQPTWLGTSRRTIHESPASGCSTGSPIGGGGSALRACERHCVDRHGNGRDWRGGCSAACVRKNRRARRTSPSSAIGPSRRNSRSEEHTSELQSLMRLSYAVFCLKKKNKHPNNTFTTNTHSF